MSDTDIEDPTEDELEGNAPDDEVMGEDELDDGFEGGETADDDVESGGESDEEEDDDEDEDEASATVATPTPSPDGLVERQEDELHCPHCFLLVQAVAGANSGECGHCGGPIS